MNACNRHITVFCLVLTVLSFLCLPMHGQDTKLKLTTVVIDAGHGGKDAGCVSKDKKTYEKSLTLSLAKLLGQKIKDTYPEVKVIYTRTTDKYLTLNERADIANRNKADLFISLHINSVGSSSPNGFSTHILGESSNKNRDLFSYNRDLCFRENSVILLEEDHTAKYQGFDPSSPESYIFMNLMHNAFYEQSLLFAAEASKQLAKGPFRNNRGISQDPFYVLWKTSMPAVLIEAGFISNSMDLRTLRSETGRNEIASRLLEAFKEFKRKYDGSMDYASSLTEAMDSTEPNGSVMYGTQILALGKKLNGDEPSFKGYKPTIYKSGNTYKYIVCVCPTEKEAREYKESIRGDFPDSFLVRIEDGNVKVIK